MRYLLDTCTISDFLRGNSNVVRRLVKTPHKFLAISTVTKHEIAYGLAKKPSLIDEYSPLLTELYRKSFDLVFDSAIAMVAGEIRHELISTGRTIDLPDIFIGATALHHDLTVVTSNTKHFNRIDSLKFENWNR